MNIALIASPFNLFKQGYGTKFNIKAGHLMPLGMAYLGAVLESKGHKVKIIDASPLGFDVEDIIIILKDIKADIVGISVFTATAPVTEDLIVAIRKVFDTPIILGGPHITCFPSESLENYRAADCIVIGEGEQTIAELIDVFHEKEKWNTVNGIGFRDSDGNIVLTAPRQYINDLDSLPLPARHLYDSSLYCALPNQYKRKPNTVMLTSRGCPFKCTFCFQGGKFGPKFRRHSVDRVIYEIKKLQQEYNIKEITFWDDIFTLNKKWVYEFCERLSKERINIVWTCLGRINTMTKNLLIKMANAGCWSIFYGIETGNQDLLDTVNKGFTLDECRRVVKWTHEAGIETRGSFMLALPGETPEMALKTIDFAIELDLTYAQFLPTYPEPGTVLYEKAVAKGKFIKYEGRTKAAYVPDGYRSPDEVEEMIRLAYRSFYLRPAYFTKHLKKIKNIEDISRYYNGFKFVLGLILKNIRR